MLGGKGVTRRFKDYLILIGALGLALCVGAAVLRFLDRQWELAIVVASIFVALGAVKARWPEHTTLRRLTWLHYGVAFALFGTAAVLLCDFSILRWWTAPVAVGLGLLYCVLHLFLPARRG